MPATLLSFAPMIDSECSRFLLAHYGVSYREAPHVFGWASVLGLFHAFTPQIPQLYGDGPVCVGPRAIVDHYETVCPADRRLIPADSMLAAQVNADWARFNGVLAGAAAVFAYFHLLPHRAIMIEPFSCGVPPWEAGLVRTAWPAFAALFKLLLQLTPANARDALDQIHIVFDEADRRLADGRRYLAAETLTLSDIAFATAAAPLLLPPGDTAPIPPFANMPRELQAVITGLRQRQAGRFAERIFQDHRSGL